MHKRLRTIGKFRCAFYISSFRFLFCFYFVINKFFQPKQKALPAEKCKRQRNFMFALCVAHNSMTKCILLWFVRIDRSPSIDPHWKSIQLKRWSTVDSETEPIERWTELLFSVQNGHINRLDLKLDTQGEIRISVLFFFIHQNLIPHLAQTISQLE